MVRILDRMQTTENWFYRSGADVLQPGIKSTILPRLYRHKRVYESRDYFNMEGSAEAANLAIDARETCFLRSPSTVELDQMNLIADCKDAKKIANALYYKTRADQGALLSLAAFIDSNIDMHDTTALYMKGYALMFL